MHLGEAASQFASAEIWEARYPVLWERCELAPDSCGPGPARAAASGSTPSIRTLDDAFVTTVVERTRDPALGLARRARGPGQRGDLPSGRTDERPCAKATALPLAAGTAPRRPLRRWRRLRPAGRARARAGARGPGRRLHQRGPRPPPLPPGLRRTERGDLGPGRLRRRAGQRGRPAVAVALDPARPHHARLARRAAGRRPARHARVVALAARPARGEPAGLPRGAVAGPPDGHRLAWPRRLRPLLPRRRDLPGRSASGSRSSARSSAASSGSWRAPRAGSSTTC